jgi:acyl-CoA thioesterase I
VRLSAWPWLAAVLALLLPASAFPQSMTLCRAKPELLELGNSLPA